MAENSKRAPHVALAISQLREFMDGNLAASKIELEARLIDSHLGNPPFEPAHLHDARKFLIERDELVLDRSATRGGGAPPIFVTTDRKGRSRKVEDAMARRRLLMSRYYSYVQGGEDSRSSLAGPAGELAFQSALSRASVGASIASVVRGMPSVGQVFGMDVPTGPLDNGFVLQPLDPKTLSPVAPFGATVLVEVKNIREWVYPRTQELYQVLMKCAEIQFSNPQAHIVPLLVCRKAHFTTRLMAKELGFFVIEAERQYLPESSLIDPVLLEELVTELGITDLVQGLTPTSTAKIENRLVTLQRYFDLDESLDRWKRYSADADIRRCFSTLFDDELPNVVRDKTLNELRTIVKAEADSIGW